ncbi:MAG: sigma-54-dependent Fis family transcriptional regulator [Marinilabiliaceae bacterium]|nr:sigma-54-dependent Fis family transcriptional regulator [Marinilabiliaceae bacterium]
MNNRLKILIVDDEKRITDKLKFHLEKIGFTVDTANTPNEGFKKLEEEPELLILDVMLPGMNGLEMLKKIKADYPRLEVVMISGYGDMDMVIQAMRSGASDFIRKPFQIMDIQLAVERTGKFIELQSRLLDMQNKQSLISKELESLIEKDFVGESDSIKRVLDIALKAAKDKDVNVLVTGENGTGKEVVSRIIHYASPRKKNVFAPVNSSAIPESLLESEFFGHIKGAFTDAKEDKVGYFEMANYGTLFLDEVAEMPHNLQTKLLRAIEEKKIKRVGSNKEIPVDVRIISATNKNVERLIGEHKFRMDLFHRINTIEINIPPLRERRSDIELILRHFVSSLSKKKGVESPEISPELIRKLRAYHFPGNVRELRNMVERALILSESNVLLPEDFPLRQEIESISNKDNRYATLDLEKNELRLIEEALRQADFNQTRAAELLNVSRDVVKRKIKKHNINIVKDIFND